MWEIVSTVGLGGLLIVLYKTINRISNSYIFKHQHITYEYPLKNYVVPNFKGCVLAVQNVLNRRYPSWINGGPRCFHVVGMDCEMTSTSVNGGHPVPATLQLANPKGFCAIFRLKFFEKLKNDIVKVPYLADCRRIAEFRVPMEDVIRQVLEDQNVLKVGVGIVDDAQYLDESYGLFVKGWLDLRHMAECAGIKPGGLDYLAEEVLGKGKGKYVIPQSWKQPWESEKLNTRQIKYASQDARLGVEIFIKLNQIVIEKTYSWLRRLFWDEEMFWKYSIKHWRKYIGKRFPINPYDDFDDFFIKNTWISYLPPVKAVISYGSKLNWRRGLKYYIPFVPESASFERMCCVCGHPDDNSLNVKTKAFVPVDYNVNFNDYSSLYYILLCKDCLEDCHRKVDYELRLELTEKYGAPYPDYQDHRLVTAKKLATELLGSSQDQGSEWILVLEANLHQLLPNLPDDKFHIRTMEIILSMDCWPQSDHGKFIHHYFDTYERSEGGLDLLRWLWCERFWRVMRPRHLPEEWRWFYSSNMERLVLPL